MNQTDTVLASDMTMRDYYAGQYLTGLGTRGILNSQLAEKVEFAYKIADAMMAARPQEQKGEANADPFAGWEDTPLVDDMLEAHINIMLNHVVGYTGTEFISFNKREKLKKAIKTAITNSKGHTTTADDPLAGWQDTCQEDERWEGPIDILLKHTISHNGEFSGLPETHAVVKRAIKAALLWAEKNRKAIR